MMQETRLIFVVIIAIFSHSNAFGALDRVSDFAVLDNAGEFHQLSRYRHRQGLALMAYDATCENMDSLVQEYQALADEFSERGIEFVLLDSLDLGREAFADSALTLPVLEDDGQLVSESLGIQHAGDVRVLNPERLALFYRGAVSSELNQTLVGVLNGGVSDTVSAVNEGCAISFPVREAHAQTPPDYVNDIAPIIIDNCADCHRQGGVGPFALDSYIMLLGWSPMIREVILNKRMPPMQVDPYIGHSNNARYLDPDEMQKMIHWIDAGAPQGSSEIDPLEQLAATTASEAAAEWQLGEPDFIAIGPSNDVPPTGVLDYVYEEVDLPFEEDRWIRAIQYRAGDASVLHHLMTFVTAPGEDFWGPERNELSVTRRFIAGYAPGRPNVFEFPQGTGVFIPQGHGLSMQFHYVTNGQRTTDETEIGLYFSDETDLREQLVQAVSARFVLPPNDHNHPLQAEHVFEEDIVLTGVRARMNYRGKKMKFAIEESDGSLREIFSVPAYNYGWQPHYILDQPEVLAAGTTVHVIGAFDNSISNPTNPDPGKELTFGLNSWDEMFTGYFTYYESP
ncbi:MAG: redoxin domain-containing protein [Gammaproteobacteria bacterium]|nr:redoxin domain-containing protein [Gammaproteobacteria bacterium]